MNIIIKHKIINFCDHPIRQRTSDGYLSATDMCKANKKLYGDWYRLDNTKEYLSELSSDMGLPTSQLVEVRKGNTKKYQQGTWVHPRVATVLALWISPKFAVKVTHWIEEWKEFKLENRDTYFREITNLVPSHALQLEKKIQTVLRTRLSAEIEVKTDVGSIDLLTESDIIELKEASKWKHALGQILSYGIFYPQKQKKIILFGDIDNIDLIRSVCSKFDVNVEIFEE